MLVWPLEAGKLKYRKDHSLVSEDDLFAFLEARKGKLDGLVITGGEPTLQKDLPEFMAKAKRLGLKIKLDTNGTNPGMLGKIIDDGLVDYLAMDLKAPLPKYSRITGVQVDLDNIAKSVKLIRESGVPYEFRTTVVPGLLDKRDIADMAGFLSGADKWYLQFFKSDTDLVNHDFEGKARFAEAEMKEMAMVGKRFVKICEIRG